MIKVQSKQGLTPYFSMERAYKAEDIIFDVHFISYICKTNYSLKVKVNFVKELLLLILDKNKPAHSIIEPLLVTQVVFERLQDEALIKALSDHLQKHFRLYSSKFEVVTTRAEDSLKLILKIPATIINNHWETLLKANSFGNNPAFFVDFM